MNQSSQVKPSDPFTFSRTGHTVKNRSVLAAMTNKQSHEDGLLSEQEIRWLSRRAEGGFGIITTAATNVSKDGKGWEGEFGLYDDRYIDRLIELTRSVHYNDCLIFAQLFHGGMRSPESLTGKVPISASKVPCKESSSGYTRKASDQKIKTIIEDFTLSADRCFRAGFDGIELHGAHGYLISQFLGKKTNLRNDSWGGDIKGRSKFLINILRSIKKSIPKSFIVGVRISPEIEELGITLDDSLGLANILRDEGIDFLHISCWDSFKRANQYPDDPKTLTEWFTNTISDLPPVISTGGIWSSIDAKNVIDQGADLIGVARAGIPYPDWGKNIQKENYDPPRPPFTARQLSDADLGDVFIDYMRNWKGFVNNE